MRFTIATLAVFMVSVAVAAAGLVPSAALITTRSLDADRAEITGAPGAVPSLADVLVITLETGHYGLVQASADGAFRAESVAPPGTTVLIKVDENRNRIRPLIEQTPLIDFHFNQLITLPGTMIRIPDPVPANGGIEFGSAVLVRTGNIGGTGAGAAPLTVRGSISDSTFDHGETLTVRLTVRIPATASGDATPIVRAQLSLNPLTDSVGRGKLTQSTFASTFLTATALPIERQQWLYTSYQSGFNASLVAKNGALEGSLTLALPIHGELPAAYYRPAVVLHVENVSLPPIEGQSLITFLDTAVRSGGSIFLPVIRVGSADPPRIPLALLMNDVEQAMRGVTAAEDRGHFALSPRMGQASDRLVIPRLDPRSGIPRRYNFEPFAPTLAMGDRGGPPAPPLIPLRFPSGELKVTLRQPDGTTRTLGPAPFAQPLFIGPGRDGHSMEGGPYITDAFRLATGNSAFEIELPMDGLYEVHVDASVDDIQGTRWTGGGTYEIDVARPLVIDPSLLFGTPLESGDVISLGATVIPPIRAEVELRVRFAPRSDAARLIERRFQARTNRFGHAAPVSFPVAEPGEYRIDVYASGFDEQGMRWAGSRTWGGVVAPRDSPLIAHGKRGIDNQQQDKQQQWFFRTQTGLTFGRGHVFIPFQTGDVMWMEEGDATTPTVSFQAPDDVVATLRRYCCYPSLDVLAQLGEIPFASFHAGRPLDLHLDESEPDVMSYAYRSVQRPLIRVREFIAEDANSYWRFNDLYGRQLGSGIEGDRPNDFKFQFAGVVLRGVLFPEPLYAVYGSFFVLVEQGSEGGTRIFPPFQGNGGGPDGGPLFTLKGRDIDLFFHPTGVRPGTILHRGQRASFAGYSAPTLPSKLEILVTSPSGFTRVISGQANKIGYFYDPGSDFRVNEAGVWRAKVRIWFDGITSAGQVTEPYPTGDVLGSREGEFFFYVVEPSSAPLDVVAASDERRAASESQTSIFLRPADGPITFTLTPPEELTDATFHYTVTMPGFILEGGSIPRPLAPGPWSPTYTYDAQTLAQDFPNLDLHDADGFAGVDTITMSFMITGRDASATTKHFARQIVLQGEELQMPEQNPTSPRQRGVRRP